MEALLKAIKNRDIDQVKKILSSNPKLASSNEAPLVFHAVYFFDEDIVKVLIEAGADPNQTCRKPPHDFGFTPLHHIITMPPTQRKIKLAEYLIDHGAMLHSKSYKISVIGFAIIGKSLEWTEFCLQKGANLKNEYNFHGTLTSPAFFILGETYNKTKEMLLLFLKYGLDPSTLKDADGNSNMLISLMKSRLECKNSHPEMLDIANILIDAGCSVNDRDECCIKDDDDVTPLQYAIMISNIKLVKLLIKRGADVNKKSKRYGTFPLLRAALLTKNNDCTLMDLLINAGADVNQKNNDGITAVMCVVRNHNDSGLAYLIKKGVNIFTKTSDGDTTFSLMFDDDGQFIDDKCGLLLIRELAKLSFEKKPIPVFNGVNIIDYYPKVKKHFDGFLKEFTKMANNQFHGVCSYYDIVNRSFSVKKLSILLKNNKTAKEFRRFKKSLTHPYGDELREIYDEAIGLKDEIPNIDEKLQSLHI